jgi:CheY-like chemotaxis protein
MNTPLTILVIEDEPSFRRTLTAYLEDSGYRVLEAANGQEGLDRLERGKPDVVVTDLRMPVMDGFEFMLHLRTANPGTPVIALTGTGDKQAQAVALDHGARECILKLVEDLQALETAIERALASMG